MVALVRKSNVQLLIDISKSVCISTEFHISEGLRRGPEFSHNNYLMDYSIII